MTTDRKTNTTDRGTETLSDAALDRVAGGLNPQPLPPGIRFLNRQPLPPGQKVRLRAKQPNDKDLAWLKSTNSP